MNPSFTAGYSNPTGTTANPTISGYKFKQLPNFTPDQMQLFQMLLSNIGPGAEQGMNYLQKLASGDQSLFEQIEAPAYASFNKALGQIGSRFSGFGGRDSSAFQNAVSGAGSELAQNLQAQRTQLQQDAIERLLGQTQSLLNTKPYENLLAPKNRGSGFEFGNLLAQALPSLLALL